jgi:glycosyltransferase involved in cell wall biosynthesis
MKLSVIICTHDPRQDYLTRTLAALRFQTLPLGDWELLVIDNASAEALASRIDLSWHSRGRHVREEELGLTPARLRGIAEAKGDLLVFVDDDNVLRYDYLEAALRISVANPHLGAFGGSIEAEFEVEPDRRFQSLLPGLAIRAVNEAKWANFGTDIVPFGAGLCIKGRVARTYATKASTSMIRRCLGRRGDNLMAGEDIDLATTSYDLGLGVGLFRELVLTHLIDKHRVAPQYLHRITVEGAYSSLIVTYLRSGVGPRDRGTTGFLIDSLKDIVRTCLGRPWPPNEKAWRQAVRRAARDIRLLQTHREIEIQQMWKVSDGRQHTHKRQKSGPRSRADA